MGNDKLWTNVPHLIVKTYLDNLIIKSYILKNYITFIKHETLELLLIL